MAKPKSANGWTDERRRAQAERLRKAIRRPDGTRKPVAQQSIAVSPGVNGAGETRARRRLTLATLEGMQRAFDKGGQKAIEKVMKTAPAIFLKMLVLLVPREMSIDHSGTVKEMTDQQIEDAIAAIKQMIAERERTPKTIDVTPSATPDEGPLFNPSDIKPLDDLGT